MQFDLFNDSQQVALRNDVIFALQRGDGPGARTAWQALRRLSPQDASLAALACLTDALDAPGSTAFADHDALRAARLDLVGSLTPAAQSLGPAAGDWLRARWQALAQRAQRLPYRAERPDDHAAPAWLQAQDWQACADAVATVASWRRIPIPLSWMLHARLKLHGLPSNWALLAELAWLSPQRLQAVVVQADEPILQALVARFGQRFEGSGDGQDLAWFPAWVLTERPVWASALTQAQTGQHTGPEQAMRVLLELLGLERQGRQRDIIERRKTLRGLNAALYAAYLATR